LTSTLNHRNRGEPSDYGFARSDVTVNEPLHGVGCIHILLDLRQYALLSAGELKRQQATHRSHKVAAR
jgi:hypothetical protein